MSISQRETSLSQWFYVGSRRFYPDAKIFSPNNSVRGSTCFRNAFLMSSLEMICSFAAARVTSTLCTFGGMFCFLLVVVLILLEMSA